MAGTGDNLIHDYSDVDRQIVWRIVQEGTLVVRRQVRAVAEDLEE